MKEEKKTSSTKQTKSKSKSVPKNNSKTTAKKTTKKSSSSKTIVTKKPSVKKTVVKEEPKIEKEIVVNEVIEEKKSEKAKEYKSMFSINFMTVIVVLLSVILVVVLLAKIYGDNQNIDYSESYLLKNNIVSQISCDDISNAITGHQSFVYIPVLNNEEEYKLEKKLASIIKERGIQDDFYLYKDGNSKCGSLKQFESEAIKAFKLEKKLDKAPVILFYKDGNLVEIIEREDSAMLNDGDFTKLLDMYEI